MYAMCRGHRVLLFSQMTRMLDIIQDYLGYKGKGVCVFVYVGKKVLSLVTFFSRALVRAVGWVCQGRGEVLSYQEIH